MKKMLFKKILIGFTLAAVAVVFGGCVQMEMEKESTAAEESIWKETAAMGSTENYREEDKKESQKEELNGEQPEESDTSEKETEADIEKTKVIKWDPEWKYAENSAIHTDSVTLYYAAKEISNGITVCINAGHGTAGGSNTYTLCHPDGSPKVTGGSTGEGQTKAAAVAGGTVMEDGTEEAEVTLKLAQIVKERLLEEGYNVLMIRESEDVQLDNIARTIMANQNADCHIALHYDSTESDKGAFYIGVPDVSSYRNMEPVASHWEEHNRLGEALIKGMRQQDVKIFGEGSMNLDLTQTSYSTVPSVDLEVGDRASDYSGETLEKLADGIAKGLNFYF